MRCSGNPMVGGREQDVPELPAAADETQVASPRHRHSTSCVLDPSWSLHLKQVSDTAVRELGVKVFCSRLVKVFEADAPEFAAFDLESNCGLIRAVLSRSGEYTFIWPDRQTG